MSWDSFTTIPTETHAFASIGIDKKDAHGNPISHSFRMNPDTVQWDYKDNATSMDTLGGRVIQLLSVKLNGLTITGRAGNRGELQRMANNLKAVMSYHVATQNPVRFKVPSRNWDFQVYVQSMPSLGWDVASTSYPYQIQLAVEEDLTGVQTKQITNAVLQNIQKDIGYNAGHHGGNAQVAYDIITTLSKNNGPGTAAAADATTTSSGDIVAIAKTQIGVPYGGNPAADATDAQHMSQADRTDPNTGDDPGGPGPTFDCSGFTWWVYTQAGCKLPGTSTSAWNTDSIPLTKGISKVDPKDALPGMMILWNSAHVAISVDGNVTSGKMIDSNGRPEGIQIVSVYGGWGGIYKWDDHEYPEKAIN